MAAAFSNPALSPSSRPRPRPRPRPPVLSSPLTLALPVHQNPSARKFSSLSRVHFSSSQLARGSFRASLKATETDPKIVTGDEANQIRQNTSDNMVDRQKLPNMKALIRAYKKAILDGDEKGICEIEAEICVVEHEKNDLSQKYAEVAAEIASGKDNYLRLKADFDNFRKRSEKDRITFTSDIQGELIENLLPMVDSFERTKQQIKPETEKERKMDTSYQGIYKQFVETMRSLGVAVVETVGKPFDPSIHEAVGREESQQFKEGIVTQELRRGFFLDGQLLRPASVKVSSGPGPRKTPLSNDGSTEQSIEAAGSVEGSIPANSGNEAL